MEATPDRTIERYLRGQVIDRKIFEARTPAKLISLIYNVYREGLKEKKDSPLLKFSNQELVDFCLDDRILAPLFEAAGNALANGEAFDSPYFENIGENIGCKEAFFKYMLERIGYVIDPRNPSIFILSREETSIAKINKEKSMLDSPVGDVNSQRTIESEKAYVEAHLLPAIRKLVGDLDIYKSYEKFILNRERVLFKEGMTLTQYRELVLNAHRTRVERLKISIPEYNPSIK